MASEPAGFGSTARGMTAAIAQHFCVQRMSFRKVKRMVLQKSGAYAKLMSEKIQIILTSATLKHHLILGTCANLTMSKLLGLLHLFQMATV